MKALLLTLACCGPLLLVAQIPEDKIYLFPESDTLPEGYHDDGELFFGLHGAPVESSLCEFYRVSMTYDPWLMTYV